MVLRFGDFICCNVFAVRAAVLFVFLFALLFCGLRLVSFGLLCGRLVFICSLFAVVFIFIVEYFLFLLLFILLLFLVCASFVGDFLLVLRFDDLCCSVFVLRAVGLFWLFFLRFYFVVCAWFCLVYFVVA